METISNENEDAGIENLNNIDKVISLLDRLYRVIEEENTKLDSMEIPAIESLQIEKIKLGKWLQIFESYLKLNPKWFKEQDQIKQDSLRNLYQKFYDVVNENHQKIEKAMAVNEYIIKWIVKEIKGFEQSVSYGRTIKSHSGTILASNDNSGISLTLDYKV